MSHTLQKKRIVRGVIAGALALAAVAGVSQNAWAATGNGLTISGNALTESEISFNSNKFTVNASAPNITVTGTVGTAATTIELNAAYTGTVTFNNVTASGTNTLNVVAQNTQGATINFTGNNNITVPNNVCFVNQNGSSSNAGSKVPLTINVTSGTTTLTSTSTDGTGALATITGDNTTPTNLTLGGSGTLNVTSASGIAIGVGGNLAINDTLTLNASTTGTNAACAVAALGNITTAPGTTVKAQGSNANTAAAGSNATHGIATVTNGSYTGSKVITLGGTVVATGGKVASDGGTAGCGIAATGPIIISEGANVTATGGAGGGAAGISIGADQAASGSGATAIPAAQSSFAGTVNATGGNDTTSTAYGAGQGILVYSGATLTLSGSVTAQGGADTSNTQNVSGYGINLQSGAKALNITGGTVTVAGGGNSANTTAAGAITTATIGGHGISSSNTPITISGGTVTATGGSTTNVHNTTGGDGINVQNTGSLAVSGSAQVNATGGSGHNAGEGIDVPSLSLQNNANVVAGGGIGGYKNGGSSAVSAADQDRVGAGIYINSATGALRVLGGSLTATGADATEVNANGGTGNARESNVGGNGIWLAPGADIAMSAGTITAQGGSGSRADNGTFAYGGNGIFVYAGDYGTGATGTTITLENYQGENWTGPSLYATGGQITQPEQNGEGQAYRAAIRGVAAGNILLKDGKNVTSPNDAIYAWLFLVGVNEPKADQVLGCAGMVNPENVWENDYSSPSSNGDIYASAAIIPAKLTSMSVELEDYGANEDAESYVATCATNGTELDANYGTATFEDAEGNTYTLTNDLIGNGIYSTIDIFGEVASQDLSVTPEENATISSGSDYDLVITQEAEGLTTEVDAVMPKTVQNLYGEELIASSEIPMFYQVTLNGNGGTFTVQPLSTLQPAPFSTLATYTQPGTGNLLYPAGIGLSGTTPTPTSDLSSPGLTSTMPLPETFTKTPDPATPYFGGWWTEAEDGEKADVPFTSTQTIYAHFSDTPLVQEVTIYRLYNPYSHEHLYTAEATEYDTLVAAGWDDEGIAWIAPDQSETPVYRLFNRYSQDHYYCTSQDEANYLVSLGWAYDFNQGAAFYSAPQTGDPIYQLFNPYEQTNTHLWTGDFNEYTESQTLGWKGEGPAWYALSLS